jgi:hypothetical protein
MHRIINAVRGNLVAWLALSVASIAVVPPAATAYCGQHFACSALEIKALSPPIGSSFEEGQEGPWAMVAPHGLEFVQVNLNTSPETGSDGHTLSDLHRAAFGFFPFFESSTNEGVYTSQGPAPYLRAGTYYWQMEADKFFSAAEYQTPIYSFVVTPAPAAASRPPAATPPVFPAEAKVPPLTLSEASSFVKSYIKRRSHRRAAHVTAKCRLTGRQTARCQATWYSALHITAATSKYAGHFSVEARYEHARYEPVTISFSGTRAQVGCLRRYSAKHCASKVHWMLQQ